jgi:hypothetical protein
LPENHQKEMLEAPSLLVVNCTKKFSASPIDPNITCKKTRGDGCFYRRQRKAIKSFKLRGGSYSPVLVDPSLTLIVLTKLLKVAHVNGKENPLILQLSMLTSDLGGIERVGGGSRASNN